MQRSDIIVDCLTFPIATGQEETRRDAIETIDAIRELKRRYPEVQTTLGVSNVSFGLNPAARAVLNSVFLAECTQAGLDSAIVTALIRKVSRAPLKIVELRLTALPSSSAPTISETNACRTGASIAATAPSAPARTSTCQSCTEPAATSSPSSGKGGIARPESGTNSQDVQPGDGAGCAAGCGLAARADAGAASEASASEVSSSEVSASEVSGCIAVTDTQIEEIYRGVPDGTPIEIRPCHLTHR